MRRLTDYKDGSQPLVSQCAPPMLVHSVRHSDTGAFSSFASRQRRSLSPEKAQT